MRSSGVMRAVFATALVFLSAAVPLLAADDAIAPPTIAAIPFANFTGSNQAADSLLPLIEKQIAALEVSLIPKDSLRNIMRAGRIRLTGAFDGDAASQLQKALNVDLLLTGSIDFYRPKANPEIGLSLRLYDCLQQRLVWSRSVAASGEDFAGLFGVGRITSITLLAQRVVADAFNQLPTTRHDLMSYSNEIVANVKRVAVVELDNVTDQPHSGRILSTLLLSQLWQQGFDVVEPGEVTAAMNQLRTSPRGAVSAEEIAQLRRSLQVDWIVTGSVYRLSTATEGAETTPFLEIGLRIIDAATGRVVASVTSTRTGNDSEGLFGAGRCYSLGKVAQRCLIDSWQKLTKQAEKRSIPERRSVLEGGEPSASR